MITWRPVDSSNVVQVGWPKPGLDLYDFQGGDLVGVYERIMLVRFKNGQAYAYLGVSRQRAVFIATRCTSVGSYINNVIKPTFPSLRVPSLDADRVPF